MRRLLILALAGFTAACSGASDDPRGVRRDEVLLQVAATGRSEVRPDEARITVGVSTTRPTAQAASAGNAETMGRVVEALGRLGVKEDDVQTRNLTLSRVDYGPQRGQFRAENLVEVRVRDVRQAGPAVAAATEAGGNVLSGPELRVSSPDAADNAAYAAAYTAARARAEAYAQAAGLKVGRVLTIRDSGVEPIAPDYGYRGGMTMSVETARPAPMSVSPPVRGGVDVREVRVRADFALSR
jgi:uncharacterized protein YggE